MELAALQNTLYPIPMLAPYGETVELPQLGQNWYSTSNARKLIRRVSL